MNRLFQFLAILVGVWLLGSFAGVMFDTARANLWTQSLMWAMLSSVILAPVFLFVGTSSDSNQSPPNMPRAEERFEVDENMEVSEPEPHGEEEWPYSSEQEETNPGGSSALS